MLGSTLMELLGGHSEELDVQREREVVYCQKVLKTFFEYGRLKSIPSRKKKERIVLEKIAESFETGRDYAEREVNIIIADSYDDFCTIRRDMIGEGLLTRDHGICRKPEPGSGAEAEDRHLWY